MSSTSNVSLPKPEPSQAGQVAGQGPPKLHLYTWPTPNGYKVSILLEELRAAYPDAAKDKLSYDVIPVDISTNVQKVSRTASLMLGSPLGRPVPETRHSAAAESSAIPSRTQLTAQTPEFLKINPNGRIPALVDDSQGGLDVWESASIELYLQEQYDPDAKFWFKDVKGRTDALSWIFFAHGGIGPMQGQAHHFYR